MSPTSKVWDAVAGSYKYVDGRPGPSGPTGPTGVAGATGPTGTSVHKFIRNLSTLTLNSTSWANMPTIASLTIPAAVGDVLEALVETNVDTAASAVFLDAVTEVGGTPTNSFGTGGAALTSTTGDGVRGWVLPVNVSDRISGSAFYTVQSGDISGGNVTVRFRYKTSIATARSIYGDSTAGSFFSVKNLGPAAA